MAALDDLVSMAVFARVVEARSFSAAARRLGLAKSAVSARVARLEDRLGARLLHRTTRAVALTEAGVRFYERCRRVVAAAEEAELAGEEASQEPSGVLRVTAPVTFGQRHLAPAAAEFLVAAPRVQLQLDVSDRVVDLVEEGFDLAIRIASLRDSSLVARKLATDPLVVVGAPSYLARRGTPARPQDLVRHDCLRYSQVPVRSEWRFTSGGRPVAVPVTGSLVANDGSVLLAAAAAGLGLAVVPSYMAAPHLADGTLVTVLGGHALAELGIYAVHPHRSHVPLKVRAFIDFLVRRFSGAAWAARAG
jgi:DNA-binding transcriptional LysR family regulator